jgi:hypothetical protein
MSRIHFPLKGVFIPAAIWQHKDLTWTDKCAFAFIDLIDPEYTTHEALARYMGIPEIEIGVSVANLAKIGVVSDDGGIITKTGSRAPVEARKEPVPSMLDGYFEKVVNEYHVLCPTMPKVLKITPSRRKAIERLHDEKIDIAALFLRAGVSPFLSGQDGKWHSCDFDWITAPTNALRIMEGRYDGAVRPGARPSRIAENLRA